MRAWLNAHPRISAAAAGVFLLVLGTALLLWYRTPALPDYYYYYDLKGGNVFEVDPAAVGPRPAAAQITAPGGGEAPRAYVYSCGRCTSGNQSVAYIEMYTPEARDAASRLQGVFTGAEPNELPETITPDQSSGMGPQQLEQEILGGRRVAKPSPTPEWFPADSPEGDQIMAAAVAPCEGGRPPTPCSR